MGTDNHQLDARTAGAPIATRFKNDPAGERATLVIEQSKPAKCPQWFLRAALLGSALFWTTPASAQDGLANPHFAGATVAQACMFNTLDIAGEFASAVQTIKAARLAPTTETAEMAMFIDASGINLILTRKVDSIACAFIVPPNIGTHAYFEIMETHVAYAFGGAHAQFLEQVSDDPSPHIDGHDWVASYPGQLSHAVSLQWGTDSGMILSVGFQQLYE